MLRDITLGQYYQADSVIHRLDPRVKLGTTVLFIISLFVFQGFGGYLVAALFLVLVIRLSTVPFKFMVKGMRSIVFLLSITVIFNLFLTPGEPIVRIWKLSITQEGLRLAVLLSIRLSFLIIGSSVMTLTTTPNQLTDGLEKMLRPLNKIKVPVHEIAMMMSIALRFIPILMEETDKIMKAQLARCAEFDSGNVIKRQRAWCRCWSRCSYRHSAAQTTSLWRWRRDATGGGEHRTRMKPLHYEKRDYIAYMIVICYLVGGVAAGKLMPLLLGSVLL